MSPRRPGRAALALLAATVAATAAHAQPAPPPGEALRIPVTETGAFQPTRTLTLEAALHRPAGAGPFPTVVFNHGSTGAGRVAATQTPRFPEVAQFFTDRGFAVLFPIRRGRGQSEGEYGEGYECDAGRLAGGVERGLADVDAAMAFVAQQPWVDRDRVLLAGMSRGGFLSVVHAATRRPPVRGVISFAGGWVAEHCDRRIHFHAQWMARAGRTATLPALWLYSENDRNYGPASVRAFHRAYVDAGGRAAVHMYPPIEHDGHILLPRRPALWTAAVDAFLAELGLR